jgi:hypothetical protein
LRVVADVEVGLPSADVLSGFGRRPKSVLKVETLGLGVRRGRPVAAAAVTVEEEAMEEELAAAADAVSGFLVRVDVVALVAALLLCGAGVGSRPGTREAAVLVLSRAEEGKSAGALGPPTRVWLVVLVVTGNAAAEVETVTWDKGRWE